MRTKFGLMASATASFWICAALFAAGVSPSLAAEPPLPSKKRFLSKRLDVCDLGSFYIGGAPKVTQFAASPVPDRYEQITIGQMYVQFLIPPKHRKIPLVVVHGGMYSGASLESTDDGREGWLPYGARRGIAMYGIDVPGRGRSGFDNSAINEGTVTGITRGLTDDEVFGSRLDGPYSYGFFGHISPQGSSILNGTLIPHGAPGDPEGPEIHGTYQQDIPLDVIDPAIAARVGAIGPAPKPTNNKLLALQHYKQLLPLAEGTLPGSTCASCTPTTISGYTYWTTRALAQLVEGLDGAIVATHSQSGIIGHHLVRVMKERGTLHKLKGVVTIEGACSLPEAGLTAQDFDRVPYLFLKGDYFETSVRPYIGVCAETVKALNASRTRTASPAAFIALDSPTFRGRFNGVTHMMMLGKKSNEVFDVIQDWVEKNVRNNPVVTSCGSGGHDDDDDDNHDRKHR